METEQLEQPNYYAVIPANVRYAKMKANAKLLYGEISALANKEGYAWASNRYFAGLYGVSETAISLWVKELAENEFIDIVMTKDEKGTARKLLLKGALTKLKEGALTKVKTNNTSINNTSNISTKVDRPEAEKYGKTEINNLFEFWEKTTGICIVTRITKNRYSANNLLKKYGYIGVTKLIEGVAQTQSDQYAPRISDFTDLQAKLNQLLVWGKRRKSQIVEVIS